MKTPRKIEAVLSFVTVLLCKNGARSSNDVYNQDITQQREFGCRWYGGSTSRLSCSCEDGAEISVKKQSIPAFETAEIEVTGCKLLKFEANSIADMNNLRSVKLSQIESIVFESESMNWYGYKEIEERSDITVPSLRVSVFDSNITLISNHAFVGRINEILFDGVTIEKILPLAISNLLHTESISIRNSLIKSVDVQAFKKFTTEYLELTNVAADSISSRTFSDITVYQNFTIENCTFSNVRPGGFSIYNPRVFQVTNTKIDHVYGEAFKILSRGTVIFRNNIFGTVDDGAFLGISLRKDLVLSDVSFVFDSNTLSTLSRYSLRFNDFTPTFRSNYINETCDCADLEHKIKESSFYGDIMCRYDNDFLVVRDFKSLKCSVITNYYVTIIISCVVSVLLVAIVVALVLYYKFVYRSKKYGSKATEKTVNLSLIVPDGRTYRETELHVIVEKTDLLTTDL